MNDLEKLLGIKATFEKAKDALKVMENTVGLDDIMVELETALGNALQDVESHIETRQSKWTLVGVSTGYNRDGYGKYDEGYKMDLATYPHKDEALEQLEEYQANQGTDPTKWFWVFYLREEK